ncbi:hypothetical protein [Micromonospora sp. 067-2]|uniref:hypothetical protein n=1 Tax=Micromonospora sp. 067-2 TaxID=2789270 RepID=UPI003979DF73
MRVPGWLDDTRRCYDTVAVGYAGLLRDALAREPFRRGILALFAERATPFVSVGGQKKVVVRLF